MPLHLLPKKSWHVNNANNVARVKRDENIASHIDCIQHLQSRDHALAVRLATLRGEKPPSPPNTLKSCEKQNLVHASVTPTHPYSISNIQTHISSSPSNSTNSSQLSIRQPHPSIPKANESKNPSCIHLAKNSSPNLSPLNAPRTTLQSRLNRPFQSPKLHHDNNFNHNNMDHNSSLSDLTNLSQSQILQLSSIRDTSNDVPFGVTETVNYLQNFRSPLSHEENSPQKSTAITQFNDPLTIMNQAQKLIENMQNNREEYLKSQHPDLQIGKTISKANRYSSKRKPKR